MFDHCDNIRYLNVSSFDTSKVTNMCAMFGWNPNLTTLDLSSFNTSSVTNMSGMFINCSKLKTIYASYDKWNTAQANIKDMFKNCGCSSVIYK